MPASVEQPSVQESSHALNVIFREQALRDLQRLIQRMEGFYLGAEEAISRKTAPLTRERYREFENWVAYLLDQGSMPLSWNVAAEKLHRWIGEAVEVYTAVSELFRQQPLSSEKMRRRYELRAHEMPCWVDYEEPLPSEWTTDEDGNDADAARSVVFEKGFETTTWEPIQASLYVDQTPTVRIFSILNFGRNISFKDVLAEMDARGYRPATEKELFAFRRTQEGLVPTSAHPAESPEARWLRALGVTAGTGKDLRVPTLSIELTKFVFTTSRADRHFRPGNLFLAVRK